GSAARLAVTTAGGKDRLRDVRWCGDGSCMMSQPHLPKCHQFGPRRGSNQNVARRPAFAEDGELCAAILAWVDLAPGQRGRLRDAKASTVEQTEQGVVARVPFERQNALHLLLGQDPLGEFVRKFVRKFWEWVGDTNVHRNVSGLVGEREQRLHCTHAA